MKTIIIPINAHHPEYGAAVPGFYNDLIICWTRPCQYNAPLSVSSTWLKMPSGNADDAKVLIVAKHPDLILPTGKFLSRMAKIAILLS